MITRLSLIDTIYLKNEIKILHKEQKTIQLNISNIKYSYPSMAEDILSKVSATFTCG